MARALLEFKRRHVNRLAMADAVVGWLTIERSMAGGA